MSTADDDTRYMQRAFDACQAGIDAGQSPFGACLVRAGEVLATAHNVVWHDHDPSGHAEVACIRSVCRSLNTVHLPGATIYCTTEPCPMCFACIHWTRLERIVFAARIGDAAAFGFNELPIDNDTMKRVSGSSIAITADCRRDDALALFRDWRDRGGRAY